MLKSYYYCDIEELEALRQEYKALSLENVSLKKELNKAIDEIADLKAKLTKRGGKTNEKKNV